MLPNAPEILALIRRWSLNLIKLAKGTRSIVQMQRRCFANPALLIQMIQSLDLDA